MDADAKWSLLVCSWLALGFCIKSRPWSSICKWILELNYHVTYQINRWEQWVNLRKMKFGSHKCNIPHYKKTTVGLQLVQIAISVHGVLSYFDKNIVWGWRYGSRVRAPA
jgi:hypothetical protein